MEAIAAGEVALALMVVLIIVAICWASVKMGRWPWEPRLMPRRQLCELCEGIGKTWVGGGGDVGTCPACKGVGSRAPRDET